MAETFLILLTLTSPFSIASPNNNFTWQSHLEYGMVDTRIKWRNVDKNSGENRSISCLKVCICTDDFANCTNRGLEVVPNSGNKVANIGTLDLTGNRIKHIPSNAFQQFKHLQHLQLGSNEISNISRMNLSSLRHLTNLGLERNRIEGLEDGVFTANRDLSILNLAFNKLTTVGRHAFKGLAQLQILVLEGNQIEKFDTDVFKGLDSLAILEINKNELMEIPSALRFLPSLQRLTLAKNHIINIPDKIFSKNRKIQQIEFTGNPIDSFHPNAFVELPNLIKLQITSDLQGVNIFPNLTGTMSIELIDLNRANIQHVPYNLCNMLPNLNTLRLRSNKIQDLPELTNCRNLRQIDLGSNEISNLPGSPFQTLDQLKDLLLDGNKLSYLSSQAFLGLQNLQFLTLEKNNISEIHKDAFMPLTRIRDLNLGQNSFPELPHIGLQNLLELKTHSNPNLKEFPNASMFPMIRLVRASYAYHCCQFIPSTYNQFVTEYNDFGDLTETVYFPGEVDLSQFGNQSLHSVTWLDKSGNATNDVSSQMSADQWERIVSAMGYGDISDYNEAAKEHFTPKEGIDCYPQPGPFLPCNDLFDWWTLRCGVWVVFLLALLGNGCVVFVLAFSRGRIDVPKFLVCNLAMADFFMGLYLGFLAVLDASTLGEFRRYAIQWQLSGACQAAGFFGVLSSELSVFTLAVITLERNYAITHAMHLNKRLSLKHAAYIMVCGWLFSIAMATLPLIGVSDYRKFAVCLPFETDTGLDLGYVVFLMFINGVAFFILMGCYLKMYCAIRGSQAWNSNDSRIAKRMALLVFTDFICWFPIAFFAITAALGADLISLEGAKVFTVFVLPLNSCCNPFLYAILTKQFKKDCVMICKAIEESRVTRGIGRCRHSSNFSNRQTPANTNSLNSGSGSGSHTKNSCNCNVKKHPTKITPHWPFDKLKALLCGFKDPDESTNQNEWNYQIAEIQQKQQKTKRHASVSSDNFSSSRSDSWKQGHCIPLRLMDHHRRRNSWTVTRKPSQDSNLSSSRNDSAASNSTQSTNTWRMSRSSVASSIAGDSIARTGSGYSDKTPEYDTGASKFKALARAQAMQRQGNKSTVPMSGISGIMKQASAGQLVARGPAGQVQLVRGKPKLIRQVAVQDEATLAAAAAKSVSFHEPNTSRQHGDACPVHHETPTYTRYKGIYAKLTESSQEEAESEQEVTDSEGIADATMGEHLVETPYPPSSFLPSRLTVGFQPRKLSTISSKGSLNRDSKTMLNLINPVGEMSSEQENAKTLPQGTLQTDFPVNKDNRKLSHDILRAPRSMESRRRVSVGGDHRTINSTIGEQLLSSGRQHTSLTNLTEPKYGPGRCTSENALIALQAKFGIGFQTSATRVVISKSDNLLNDKCIVDHSEDIGEDAFSERVRLQSPMLLQTETAAVISLPVEGVTTETHTLLSPEPPASLTSHSSSRRTPTIEEEPDEFDKLI